MRGLIISRSLGCLETTSGQEAGTGAAASSGHSQDFPNPLPAAGSDFPHQDYGFTKTMDMLGSPIEDALFARDRLILRSSPLPQKNILRT
jgi:hypothetical protein